MSGITNIKDVARGLQTTAEVVDLLLLDEGDFTAGLADFPVRADIPVGGELLTIPVLGATVTLGLPIFKFAIQKGKSAAKKEAGAGPGYEVYSHDGLVGELVGLSKDQWLSLDKYNNKPVVAIARYADGRRRVFGSIRVPLQAIFEETSGAEGATLKVEFKTTGKHNFMPPWIATAATLTLLP